MENECRGFILHFFIYMVQIMMFWLCGIRFIICTIYTVGCADLGAPHPTITTMLYDMGNRYG